MPSKARIRELAYATTQCDTSGETLLTVESAISTACAEQREEDAAYVETLEYSNDRNQIARAIRAQGK